jgi:hypothetical protein
LDEFEKDSQMCIEFGRHGCKSNSDSNTISMEWFLRILRESINPRNRVYAPHQIPLVEKSDGQMTHRDLQAGRAQDKMAPIPTAPLPQGALRIANLGYLSIPVLTD